MAWCLLRAGAGRSRCGPVLGAILALIFALSIFGAVVAAEAPSVEEAGVVPSPEEIVARVRDVGKGPKGRFTFRQEVTLRWMFSTWNFHSEVVANRGRYDIRTYDAPSFVPRELSGALLQVGDELDRFTVELVGVEELEDGTEAYVLTGQRRPEYSTGAQSGRIWVRSDTWLIERLEIHYPWGHLDVRQEHQTIRGHYFPRRQEVTVSPLGATMDIRYGWFWFDDFL